MRYHIAKTLVGGRVIQMTNPIVLVPIVLVRPLGSSLTSLSFLLLPITMVRLTLISEEPLGANRKRVALLLSQC